METCILIRWFGLWLGVWRTGRLMKVYDNHWDSILKHIHTLFMFSFKIPQKIIWSCRGQKIRSFNTSRNQIKCKTIEKKWPCYIYTYIRNHFVKPFVMIIGIYEIIILCEWFGRFYRDKPWICIKSATTYSNENRNTNIKQMFVTVSAKLCSAIRNNIACVDRLDN